MDEPKFYHEVVKDAKWREAINEEIEALDKTGTWEIVDLPPGMNPIGCKWVYRVKYNSDGSIQRYKVRLVIRGDHQKEGINSIETFALVENMTSVRCFPSIAIAQGWKSHQLDVNNAFLHGYLN